MQVNNMNVIEEILRDFSSKNQREKEIIENSMKNQLLSLDDPYSYVFFSLSLMLEKIEDDENVHEIEKFLGTNNSYQGMTLKKSVEYLIECLKMDEPDFDETKLLLAVGVLQNSSLPEAEELCSKIEFIFFNDDESSD